MGSRLKEELHYTGAYGGPCRVGLQRVRITQATWLLVVHRSSRDGVTVSKLVFTPEADPEQARAALAKWGFPSRQTV